MDYSNKKIEKVSQRRQRLHELLIALLHKQEKIELMNAEGINFEMNRSNNVVSDPALLLERNKRILNQYQGLVRSAIALDALLDSEFDGI